LLPLLELPLHDGVELDAATAVDDDAMHAKRGRCRWCRRKKRISVSGLVGRQVKSSNTI
jgi:hypothetical protein